MAEEIASPAQRMLETQFSCVRFLSGVEDGRWELQRLAWPHAYVRVTGRDPDSGLDLQSRFSYGVHRFP
jgi:hypothetical protein